MLRKPIIQPSLHSGGFPWGLINQLLGRRVHLQVALGPCDAISDIRMANLHCLNHELSPFHCSFQDHCMNRRQLLDIE
jgi:hypothetical protein